MLAYKFKREIIMTANNTQTVSNIINTADKIFGERERFETVTLAKTNEELYGILSKVYTLYNDAESKECMKDTVLQMKDKLAGREMQVQKNTPALTVFVRYIFNCDRKRAYKYVQVIKSAIQKNVDPTLLENYINENNGIEKIKTEHTKTEKQLDKEKLLEETIEEVKDSLHKKPAVKTLKFEDENVALSDGVEYAFVIARVKVNGELELLRSIPKPTLSMQNSAIKSIAQSIIKANSEESANEEEAALEQTRQEAAGRMKAA